MRRRLAGVILLLAAAASPAWADSPPGGLQDNATLTQAVSNYLAPAAADNSWVDRTHAYLSRNTLDTVQWFDDFFGDKTREPAAPAESTVRWRNNFRFGTDRVFTYRTDLRANIRLAQLSRKLRIVFSAETFEDALGINRDATATQGVPTGTALQQSSTEIRYELLHHGRSEADIGTGVLVKLPFVFFTRARYRYALPLGDNTLLRFSPNLFWRTRDGLGESTAIDLEHQLSGAYLLRWANSETATEKTNGMEWNSEPGLLHALGKDKAVTYAVGISGATRPAAVIGTYYALVRYRQGILRDWLFVEVEPIQSWLRGPTGGYSPVSAVTFRFEVFIKGIAGEKAPAR
jgi:hypothetical protein